MTNTFVIENWKNINEVISEDNPLYNLKVYRGFLPKESRRIGKRIINVFSGKTLDSLAEFCKKEDIGFGEGPLRDYITTSSIISVQAGNVFSGVGEEELIFFYGKMKNLYGKD